MLSSFPNIQVEYNFQDHFIAVLSKGEKNNFWVSKQLVIQNFTTKLKITVRT